MYLFTYTLHVYNEIDLLQFFFIVINVIIIFNYTYNFLVELSVVAGFESHSLK